MQTETVDFCVIGCERVSGQSGEACIGRAQDITHRNLLRGVEPTRANYAPNGNVNDPPSHASVTEAGPSVLTFSDPVAGSKPARSTHKVTDDTPDKVTSRTWAG